MELKLKKLEEKIIERDKAGWFTRWKKIHERSTKKDRV